MLWEILMVYFLCEALPTLCGQTFKFFISNPVYLKKKYVICDNRRSISFTLNQQANITKGQLYWR
jgi:hypothetical protein